jgi:hypothetical protein
MVENRSQAIGELVREARLQVRDVGLHELREISDVADEAERNLLRRPRAAVAPGLERGTWLRDGAFRSKEEGGLWALSTLPAELVPVVQVALAACRGRAARLSRARAERFARFVDLELGLRRC